MEAVTGVTGKNKTFIIIFAPKSLIITCDTCDTRCSTAKVAVTVGDDENTSTQPDAHSRVFPCAVFGAAKVTDWPLFSG